MPRVLIAGNSGAARECYWILRDLQQASPGLAGYYEFGGFLSWQGYAGDLKELAGHFLGPLEEHAVAPDELYVIGVGAPYLRRAIFAWLRRRDARLMNLIHPWTAICPSAVMGEGNVFQRGCTVYANAVIGNGNYINGAANLSHDARVGDFNFLAPYAIVLGGASLGDLNHLGPHAVVLEGARMGNGNSLAPGSTLYKGCGDHARLSGSPALKIGEMERQPGDMEDATGKNATGETE